MCVVSVALFASAAAAEIGGAYLIWTAVRNGAGLERAALGALALTAYGLLASLQMEPHFGRVLAAYGGVLCGSLLWGIALDGFRPDRFDLVGAALCLLGAAIIAFAPRAADP